jgi:small subunit ribosomal protein S15
MYLSTDKKKEIFAQFGGDEKNTGLSESQIALFTHRISHLTGHLKKNKHDYSTQTALINLVGKRRSLLNYLHKNNIDRYRAIIAKLSLRK